MNIFTVAHYTFKEIVKSKILYHVSLLGFALMLVTYVATEFTYGVPERVALDFGIGLFSLSAIAIALFMGVGLVSREVESRTVYMVLSRSVSRFSFLLGKIIGLAMVLIFNIFILSVMTISVFLLIGGSFETLILWVIIFSLIEALLILNVVVLFSLVTNSILSVLYAVIIYILGHAIPATLKLSMIKNNEFLESIVSAYSFFFPNLAVLNYREHLLYSSNISQVALLQSFVYGVSYCIVLMLFTSFIFSKRDLN